MNLNLINQQAIESHTSYVNMQLFLFTGQTFLNGVEAPQYSSAIPVSVNVQLYNNQKLRFENNTLTTTIYKRLFINYVVNGLNRDLGTGGDYLLYTNPVGILLKYRVIMVLNTFPSDNLGNTGYTEVVAVESSVDNE